MSQKNKIMWLIVVLFLFSCGGSGTSKEPLPANSSPVNQSTNEFIATENHAIPDNSQINDYNVLMMGNSHISMNGLPEILASLIQAGKPNANVTVEVVNRYSYLAPRLTDGITIKAIESKPWSHVIFQGQQYSQSASRTYSTDAAEYLIHLAKTQGATPILFPEHAQQHNTFETQYVIDIHEAIIKKQQSCLAPVGLAWQEALGGIQGLLLHHADGNHANINGTLLTALVFYQVVTNEYADALPPIESIAVSHQLQGQLGEIASLVLDQYQACNY